MSRLPYKDRSAEQRAAIKVTLAKYHRTPAGFLSRLYKNMRGRVEGIQSLKAHLYKGLYLLPRDDFYAWAMSNDNFHTLYNDWVNNNYDRKLTPSVDRIDPQLGYTVSNIRWLTHSENSRLGAISRHHGRS